jgi:UDP-2,3-diacylglucosamine hydrolase
LHLFISDLHLHPSRPGVTELFLGFLKGPAKGAEGLYILGDLFDSWAGDDDLADPFNAAVCAALKQLTAGGVATAFISGNRDLLIGEAFAAASGIELLAGPSVAAIAGSPTLLLHGDELCTDDLEYQRYRATVHDPAFQRDFLAKPLAERKAFIAGLREKSSMGKQSKPAAIMDTNGDAVAAAFRDHGVSRMIHGHTHREACHRLNVDGRSCERWVLGDWHDDAGSYLECSAAGCTPRPWCGA